MMETIKFTIPLPPVTKKNSLRITKGGKILPSKAYEQYEKSVGWFLPHKGEKISRPCEVVGLFYMPTKRIVDLVNLEEALNDVLVKHGVLEDDNSRIIVSQDGSRVLYDKNKPRTEVTIRFF